MCWTLNELTQNATSSVFAIAVFVALMFLGYIMVVRHSYLKMKAKVESYGVEGEDGGDIVEVSHVSDDASDGKQKSAGEDKGEDKQEQEKEEQKDLEKEK